MDLVVPTAIKAPQMLIVNGSPSDSENFISCLTVPFKKIKNINLKAYFNFKKPLYFPTKFPKLLFVREHSNCK